MDRRLQERCEILVKSHLGSAKSLVAGAAHVPETSTLAATQAAWRFLNNDHGTLPNLVLPLREIAAVRAAQLESPFVLLAHDWSKLSFSFKKADVVQLTHERDVGYELTTALLISPDDGQPLAPLTVKL